MLLGGGGGLKIAQNGCLADFSIVFLALCVHEYNIIDGIVPKYFQKRFQFQFYKKHYKVCYKVVMAQEVRGEISR